MQIIYFYRSRKNCRIDDLQHSGSKNRIMLNNLNHLIERIIWIPQDTFKIPHHRREGGKPLPVAHEIPTFSDTNTGTHRQVMFEVAEPLGIKGQRERPVRSPTGHGLQQKITTFFLGKYNSDAVRTCVLDKTEEILLPQTGDIDIADDHIRNNANDELPEGVKGGTVANKMLPVTKSLLEKGPLLRIILHNKNRILFHVTHKKPLLRQPPENKALPLFLKIQEARSPLR